jgi:hypothetical protein
VKAIALATATASSSILMIKAGLPKYSSGWTLNNVRPVSAAITSALIATGRK